MQNQRYTNFLYCIGGETRVLPYLLKNINSAYSAAQNSVRTYGKIFRS